MKRNLTLVLFVSCAVAATAQKHQVKIGGGIGTLPYERTLAWNIDFQYEHRVNPVFSGFAALGTSRKSFTVMGNYGRVGSPVWQYEYSERLAHLDAGIKRRVFRIGKRYEAKVALGGTLLQSTYNHPDSVTIREATVVRKDDVTRKRVVGMFLLGLENSLSVTDRFSVSVSLNYRTTFNEKHVLVREVIFRSDSKTVSVPHAVSGILHQASMTVQLGYLF